MQLRQNLGWKFRRSDDTVPCRHIEAGKPLLGHRRNIRCQARAYQPGRGDGSDLAVSHEADLRSQCGGNEVHPVCSIYPKLSYDLLRDFAPVTQFTAGLYMLVVHPSIPARSVKDLIALARARPGQLTFGSVGTGTGTHLTGELFKASAKVDVLHVPYRGNSSCGHL